MKWPWCRRPSPSDEERLAEAYLSAPGLDLRDSPEGWDRQANEGLLLVESTGKGG